MAVLRTFDHQGRIYELTTFEPAVSDWGAGEEEGAEEPQAGAVSIGPVTASPEALTWGEMLSVAAQVDGDAVAFVYTELLLYDPERGQAYGPVYREPVMPAETHEVGGVEIPDWETPLEIVSGMQPFLWLVGDGTQAALAFVKPDSGSPEGGYTLEGLYQSAAEGALRQARLFFDADGQFRKALAFTERGLRSLPAALTLRPGDRFTPRVGILTPPADEAEDGTLWEETAGLSNPLILGEASLRLEEERLIPGEYYAGFLVRDLDGFDHRRYAKVTVA